MTGQFIFTRSWRSHGKKLATAGSYMAEITPGVFGARQPEAEERIEEKIRRVPNELASADSSHSLLLLYHPNPGATVASHSWHVTDRLTGRGPSVPFTAGIAFTGDDNKRFLLSPANTLDPGSFLPYCSFVERESRAAPPPRSHFFPIPKPGDCQPMARAAKREEQRSSFGFGRETFAQYFAALCGAVSAAESDAPENKKVIALLPASQAGEPGRLAERLICASLRLLPLWLKGQFGACSNWIGSLGGSSAPLLDGIQHHLPLDRHASLAMTFFKHNKNS